MYQRNTRNYLQQLRIILFRLVQVGYELFTGGLGGHPQHLHLAARHLLADPPEQCWQRDLLHLISLHHVETLFVTSRLKISR